MPLPLRTATLGCKVNQYETEFVRQALVERGGFHDAAADEPAALCIVNTCTVTAEGDAKSRQLIRQLARRNPEARIVVMGCYATRAPDEVARLPGVVEVVADKRELPDLLMRHGVSDVPTGLAHYQGRKRAIVKVQDGCLLRCSFCIIPLVRPAMTSRPLADVVAEVERLVRHGHREIVLTGIHLGHYGVDRNQQRPKPEWERLSHLVARLAQLPGEFRLRLSSIEATEVTRELLEVMAERADKVCPHLHVCLQSGSDDVLRRMRRRWGAQRFLDRLTLARDMLDQPAFTTDVMVGFPGETEANFAETLAVCDEAGFSRIHAFPFSARLGTPAAAFSDQVSAENKHQRTERLAELDRRLRQRFFESLIGRRLQLLVEGQPDDGSETVLGTSCRYATVRLPMPAAEARRLTGRLVDVVATGADADRALMATPAPSCC